jgi:hypothetical protein
MQNNWETASTFSKKVLGRSNSIRTKNSSGSRSRRNSVSHNSINGMHNTPSDHILSWRNTVLDNSSIRNGGLRASQSERSLSPSKLNRASFQSQSTVNSQNNLASAARQQPYVGTSLQQTSSTSTISPPPSIHKRSTPETNTQIPTPSFSFQSVNGDNSRRLEDGKSYQFWNPWRSEIKMQLQSAHDPTKLSVDGGGRDEMGGPLEDRKQSMISQLSSEATSPGDESEGEPLSCRKCGGRDFRAKKMVGRAQRLICTKCGTSLE